MNKRIAFVTVSKGRLHHLQRTAPLIAAQAPDEFIVVDYGCPQGSADWIEAHVPSATVVRVTDDPGFCLPRARNIGANASRAQWICFIDADVMIQPGFVDWIRGNVHHACFYRAAPVDGTRDPETWGTVVCRRGSFYLIDGYDEVFRGWGGEDADLYQRLRFSGFAMAAYPSRFVEAIRHEDAERVAYHAIKDRQLQHLINRTYAAAKYQMMAAHGFLHQLPLEARMQWMNQTREAVLAWAENPSGPPPTVIYETRVRRGLTDTHRLSVNARIAMRVELSAPSGAPPADPFSDAGR